VTALADRQSEFCSALMVGSLALGLPGLPMRSAAAIGGNGTQENLCQPVTLGAKDHGSDGVLQWRLDRLDGPDGLHAWCAANGLPWDTLACQALFTLHELTQPQYAVLAADLRAGAKSLETLTLNFCDAYERPSAEGRVPDLRIKYAHDCLTILMRDAAPGPFPVPLPSPPPPQAAPIGACTMPIELILQLVAPLAESLVTGLLKGALTHAQQTGTLPIPASHPTLPIPHAPAPAPSGLTQADFAVIAQMIEAEFAKLSKPTGTP
jgi:Phage tail lysozyme